jgi:hypothetical protein
MKKKLVLVFNKIDLIGQATLASWMSYFKNKYPDISMAAFSCYPKDGFMVSDEETSILKKRIKRKYKRYYRSVGVLDVIKACRDVELIKEGVKVNWEAILEKAQARLSEQEAKDELKNHVFF